MNKSVKYFIDKKTEFQPYVKEPKTLFLYIAPLDHNEREKFFSIINKPLLISIPKHLILRDDQKVMSVLLNNFPQKTVLDIFISTFISNPIELTQSLKEYIKEHNINFEY
jgi:hypothetical protein